jgi:hypothetical protein
MPGWTVVIWATVTPDLEDAIEADLREAEPAMAAVVADDDIHVHVIVSRPGVGPEPYQWPDTVRKPDAPGSGTTMGQVLANTSCWGTRQKPGARNRLLVLWGHGALFFPSSGSSLAVPAAEEVFHELTTTHDVVDEAQPAEPALPHIVGYDACRMATAANVLTLAETLDTVPEPMFIGSMVPEPASGWPYFQLLRILRDHESPKAVAAAVVEAYAASVDVPEWCLVAVSLAKVHPLSTALMALRGSAAPNGVHFFQAAAGADIMDDTDLVDLGALMRRLGRITPHPEADAVRRALRGATIARRAAGSLAGRDGVSVRLGLPFDAQAAKWSNPPTWDDYLPGFPALFPRTASAAN